VAEGHEVTLFIQGNYTDVFPEMEQLRGDREKGVEGLKALEGREWDAVIDTSGYVSLM
jgi:2'-hydroxyisoflavone reductase